MRGRSEGGEMLRGVRNRLVHGKRLLGMGFILGVFAFLLVHLFGEIYTP